MGDVNSNRVKAVVKSDIVKCVVSVLRGLKRKVSWLVSSFWTFRARMQFLAQGQPWPKNMRVHGGMGFAASGELSIGDNVTIVNSSKYNRAGVNHPTQLISRAGSSLKIGSNVGISGASIFCTDRIEIGDHVLIGVNCSIYDTDFHSMNYLDRRSSGPVKSAPVFIEDDVWLCANVLVLKGVRIGARSVIGANSVVTKDIPADTLAAGVPAIPIGKTS